MGGELCAEASYLCVYASPPSTVMSATFKLFYLLERKLMFINYYLSDSVHGVLHDLKSVP